MNKRVMQVEVKPPATRGRTIFSALVLIATWITSKIVTAVIGPIGASLAVDQVTGGDEEYVIMRLFSGTPWQSMIWWIAIVVLLYVWISYGVKYHHYATAQQEEE